MTINNQRYDAAHAILVFAYRGQDAKLAYQLLGNHGFTVQTHSDLLDLTQKMFDESNGVILDAAMLTPQKVPHLSILCKNQPPWSDVPIFIMMQSPQHPAQTSWSKKIKEAFGNVTLVHKPILTSTLISLVKAAQSSRLRQRELRAIMEKNEQELAWRTRMEAELRTAREAADAANRAKSAFLANLSHEIRTPLCAILGFSEILKVNSLTPEDRAHYLGIIEHNGQQLMTLINDVLDLSKIEAGHLKPENIETNLQQLLADVETTLVIKAQEKNDRLIFHASPGLPAIVLTDPMRLRQILINIVGNAIKFTSGGTITVQTASKLVPETASLCELSFTVTDTGCGVPSQSVCNLFQPFIQADSSTTRHFGGTGLGLALSRRLAQTMGGDVILKETVVSKGSTFVVTIRAEVCTTRAVAWEPTSSLQPKDQTQGAQALANLHVLLAEDTVDNQVLIRRLLEMAGAHVDLASNGIEALEHCLHQDYDAILMDIQMPFLDGYLTTKSLRQRGYRKPIIALTAHAFSDESEKSIAAGCTLHMAKPIDRQKLINALHDACAHDRPVPSAQSEIHV